MSKLVQQHSVMNVPHVNRRAFLAAGSLLTLSLTGCGCGDTSIEFTPVSTLARGFYMPTGVAVDSSGNIYVSDTGNNAIRKITSSGGVTTLAGSSTSGFLDGTATAAQFSSPQGLAVDVNGNIYVSDTGNNAIRKITPAGVVTTLAGLISGGSANGPIAQASFSGPVGIAVDVSGNIYVADSNNNMVRMISTIGDVTTLAGSTIAGLNNSTGTNARFDHPTGVAVDANGNVYVADAGNNLIRQVTSAGVVTTFAGSVSGSTNGTGTVASFNSPYGISIDTNGVIYVGDTGNNLIRKITPAGVVTTLAGSTNSGSADGGLTDARFNFPVGVTSDSTGAIYVADMMNNTIRKIQ